MRGHRIDMTWRDRWATSELHEFDFAGSDREILRLLDRHEVDAYPLVTIHIDTPNPTALEYGYWEALLRVEGERAVVMTNSGVWYVGVVPGSGDRRGAVEFTNPRGTVTTESADLVIPRDLGFRAIRAWLEGRESAVAGLEWVSYRGRGRV